MDDEYEYKWFWEVNGIYDLDGDLLIWSLMGVVSMQESIYMSRGCYEFIHQLIIEKDSSSGS